MIDLKIFSLVLFAGSLFGGSAALAQTAPNAPAPAPAQASMAPDAGAPAHHQHANRMAVALRSLDLSDDQQAKIKDIMTAYRSSRDSATPETRKQMRAQIEGVLTPEQRTRFAAQMQHHGAAAASPAP